MDVKLAIEYFENVLQASTVMYITVSHFKSTKARVYTITINN